MQGVKRTAFSLSLRLSLYFVQNTLYSKKKPFLLKFADLEKEQNFK